MSRKEQVKRLVSICLILVLVLVILYSGLRILESTVFRPGPEQQPVYISKNIEKDGKTYVPRNDITVMMVLGIDERGPVTDSGSYKNSGEADMVSLIIFDEASETINILTLNRDTMLDMPVLGVGGKQAGTKYAQLALSHTYGSGLEDSCKNTRKAVSDFLNGLDIDYYVAWNMDTVAILNDAVGGVTINVTEDFSTIDPTIAMGEVTLTGEQALTYVQMRRDVGDQKNTSRMERQKVYMIEFLKKFREKWDDEKFVIKTYDQVSPYMVTDFTTKSISNILGRYADYEIGEIITPKGENKLEGEYYEFYVDEAALEELILQYLYKEKK